MRTWRLTQHDPYTLTLAADAQLASPDYCDDHIWQLSLDGGEPSAVAIQTTFGLRARMMRFFPRFSQENIASSDPNTFNQLPALCQFYTNYAQVTFSPYAGIDVISEYWVPNSQGLMGRMRITNNSVIPRQVNIELISMLTPMSEGQEMHPETVEDGDPCLAGQTANLYPVFMVKDLKELNTSPYPAYLDHLELAPGNSRTYLWASGATPDQAQSYRVVKELLDRSFDGEVARLMMQAANRMIDIQTGDPDWDAVLAFSQVVAQQLFLKSGEKPPFSSFVISRQPDQGYSRRQDGSDYNDLWNGQTAFDAYYLSSLILPGAGDLIEGVFKNFLEGQTENGFIDGKPGLVGQRGRFLATPILASLAWRTYQSSKDTSFLAQIFPQLVTYIKAWFDPDHDRDQDGFPEWENTLQTGFEENPVFDRWKPTGLANDITCVESPALAALIYHELNVLILIAKDLGQMELVSGLERKAAGLKALIESTWDSRQACYHYRDRDSHQSPTGEIIGEFPVKDEIVLSKKLKKPQRLMIVIEMHGEGTRTARFLIHGSTTTGQSDESIAFRAIHWAGNRAVATTQNVFLRIDSIEIHGLSPTDKVTLQIPDLSYDDLSLNLPLWARVPGDRQAKNLIKKSILSPKRFLRPYGLSACPDSPSNSAQGTCPDINIPWINLIGEGLLSYGYQNETADLLKRVLAGIVQVMKREHAFYRNYHAESGIPSGERNVLSGLAPVGLFLQTLGITIISPTHVIIRGANPFSRTMTVKFRGLCIVREDKSTTVTFPDGQSTRVTGGGAHQVFLA